MFQVTVASNGCIKEPTCRWCFKVCKKPTCSSKVCEASYGFLKILNGLQIASAAMCLMHLTDIERASGFAMVF